MQAWAYKFAILDDQAPKELSLLPLEKKNRKNRGQFLEVGPRTRDIYVSKWAEDSSFSLLW